MKVDNGRIIDKDSFEKVRRCVVRNRVGDTYFLSCKLYKKGNKDVIYKRGDNFLMWHARFRYLLSESAVEDVERELKKFDERIRNVKLDDTFSKADFLEADIVMYYKRNNNGTFNWMIEEKTRNLSNGKYGEKKYTFVDNLEIGSHFHYDVSKNSLEVGSKLFYAGYNFEPENLHKHPLYISAVRNNDEWLMNELDAKFGINNEKAIEYMEKKDGIRRLPFLSKEYDRRYTISRDNIDYGLLCASGYELLHRPYFDMQGSSHNLCELNPYRKEYIDAGKTETEVIDFKDYLTLFGEKYYRK